MNFLFVFGQSEMAWAKDFIPNILPLGMDMIWVKIGKDIEASSNQLQSCLKEGHDDDVYMQIIFDKFYKSTCDIEIKLPT